MQTVCSENRQKFVGLVLHELFRLESVCAIGCLLLAIILEGKMGFCQSVTDGF